MEEYEARLWLQRDLDLVQRKKRRASWGLFYDKVMVMIKEIGSVFVIY